MIPFPIRRYWKRLLTTVSGTQSGPLDFRGSYTDDITIVGTDRINNKYLGGEIFAGCLVYGFYPS